MKKFIAVFIAFCLCFMGCKEEPQRNVQENNQENKQESTQEELQKKAEHLQFLLYTDLTKEDGGTPSEGDRVIYDNDDILLDGASVESAEAVTQENSGSDTQHLLSLKFTDTGAVKFARITGDHVGEQLAIVIDGRLISYPTLMEAIEGGKCQISGNFSQKEAEAYALLLN